MYVQTAMKKGKTGEGTFQEARKANPVITFVKPKGGSTHSLKTKFLRRKTQRGTNFQRKKKHNPLSEGGSRRSRNRAQENSPKRLCAGFKSSNPKDPRQRTQRGVGGGGGVGGGVVRAYQEQKEAGLGSQSVSEVESPAWECFSRPDGTSKRLGGVP